MPQYAEDFWRTYLADGDAERLVQCVYDQAKKAARIRAEGKNAVRKATEALIQLTLEKDKDTPIPRKEIYALAGTQNGLWPWLEGSGAPVLQESTGPKGYFIKHAFYDAFLGLKSLESRSILRLQGLGKEIWAGIDAQEYVNRERSSWGG